MGEGEEQFLWREAVARINGPGGGKFVLRTIRFNSASMYWQCMVCPAPSWALVEGATEYIWPLLSVSQKNQKAKAVFSVKEKMLQKEQGKSVWIQRVLKGL